MSVDHFFDGLMVMGPRSADGGKSAYAYAVEGGYTGTETEFAERLAFLMNGAVVGYMEDSTIILSGDLAPGTYTFAYVVPRSDGTTETVTIGTYTVEESEEPDVAPATYAVTFVADGVTVDTVEYQEGDTALERVPDVPAKEGYTGAWEEYTLDGNITVHAVYTEIETEPEETAPTNFANPSDSLWQRDYRLATGVGNGKTDGGTGHILTNFIPAKKDDVIYVTGLDITGAVNSKYAAIGAYKNNTDPQTDYQSIFVYTGIGNAASAGTGAKNAVTVSTDESTGVTTYSYTILVLDDSTDATKRTNKATSDTAYIRIDGIAIEGVADSDIVINVKRDGEWL